MAGDVRTGARLATRVEQLAPTIIEGYEAELRRQESPLLHTERSRSQCLNHARQLLKYIAAQLTGTQRVPQLVAMDLGTERATQGFHASDSLRAAGILFAIIIQTLVDQAMPEGLSVSDLTLAALTVNDVITASVSRAAYSYTGFLLSRIHEAHIEERRRISRELHDRIGNGMNIAFRNLDLFDIYRVSEPVRAAARVQRAQHMLGEALEQVRQVVSDLRAEPLDSMEKEINRFVEIAGDTSIRFDVAVNGDEHWASSEIRDEAFLIIREALRNILSHAEATAILVRIDVTPDELRAVVDDDGIGFDPRDPHGDGSGLNSMRERAALLGGIVIVTAAPGRGTQVSLTIPLGGRESEHGGGRR
jgi:signal transduction histidine kinase